MLLNIYLGTTIISWIILTTKFVAFKEKLEREGYKFVKENKTFSENIISSFSGLIISFAPFLNIITTMTMVFWEDILFEELKNKYIKEGKLCKIVNEKSDSKKQFEGEDTNAYTMETHNIKREKTYSEMTIEEKIAYLEQEKENLLRQKCNETGSAYTKIKK